jgi:endonuclease/exonuclease/phosphatase family metal-dependent hydrolase
MRIVLLLAFLSAATGPSTSAADVENRDALRVLTYNVWHGLRSGESNKRFPGEEPEDKARRFAAQIGEIERLEPDLLLFQEVNPNQPQARKYAQALGYDEIHKVTSCGLHLGAIYKIPRNMNEGLAILARPELGLRRVGAKRLSGNAKCTATFGFQTKESRYALFGEVVVGGRRILVATTHLSSPPFVPSDFEQRLDELVEEGALEVGQREEILSELERKRRRSLAEAQRLLHQIDKRRYDRKNPDRLRSVILGGDFNAEPGSPAIVAIEEAGFRSVAAGPAFLTWDPARNHANYELGSRRAEPLPTFGISRVEALLAARRITARQIDHIFVSGALAIDSSAMVLDREVGGRYLSDHFALLGVLRIEE